VLGEEGELPLTEDTCSRYPPRKTKGRTRKSRQSRKRY